jgi:hypothetical protein
LSAEFVVRSIHRNQFGHTVEGRTCPCANTAMGVRLPEASSSYNFVMSE